MHWQIEGSVTAQADGQAIDGIEITCAFGDDASETVVVTTGPGADGTGCGADSCATGFYRCVYSTFASQDLFVERDVSVTVKDIDGDANGGSFQTLEHSVTVSPATNLGENVETHDVAMQL